MAYPTLDAYAWRPVHAGLWTHQQLIDDVFTFADLMDAHEFLDVKAINEKRVQRYLEKKRGA